MMAVNSIDSANIPKTIHYCWFGGNKTTLANRCIDSWRKTCPEYKIIEWNEHNYDLDSNRFAKEAYDKKKYGFVVDPVRLDIIYRYGGIYLDCDV
jgi:mannosyltransferase OCH1-like enzyme